MLQQPLSQRGFNSTISAKGQVTIPVEVRRFLQVNTKDKITFIIEKEGEIKLAPAPYPNITSLKGAAGSIKNQLSFKQMKQVAYEDRLKTKYEK